MKIVILDVNTVGRDLDLSMYHELAKTEVYGYSTPEEIRERVKDADVVITNKMFLNESTLCTAENLKLVCVTGTGTNNLDLEYLKSRGIAWRNVVNYSTDSVAQHTFALLLALLDKLPFYDQYVKSETYVNDAAFTHFGTTFHELTGKTFGIIGLGNIGRKVASIAEAFGCKVIYCSPSGSAPQEGYHQVSFEELLKTSDIVSVHAPLNQYTEGLMNETAFKMMKNDAIFLNLGRGPIVVEKDLRDAIVHGEIAAAGIDVLSKEPMSPENPLLDIKDSNRLIITPHVAWAAKETRARVMELVLGHIKDFFCIS